MAGIRHRSNYFRHYYYYPSPAFFIDWIRKPQLRVTVLPTTFNYSELLGKRSTPYLAPVDPIEDHVFLAHGELVPPDKHKSQFHAITWKQKGESVNVLDDKARLMLCFGVLKVVNEPRRGIRRREGIATNVKADLRVKTLGVYSLGGEFFPLPESSQLWTDRRQLIWYDSDWHFPFASSRDEQSNNAIIEELKRIIQNPMSLMRYLKGESQDMIQVGRDAYILLFYTLSTHVGFIPTSGVFSFLLGKFQFIVSLYANESKPVEYSYEVDVRSWNDFTIREI